MSPRQAQALAYLQSRSPPPSINELANHLRVSHTRAVAILTRLAALGVIAREPGKHRAIRSLQ